VPFVEKPAAMSNIILAAGIIGSDLAIPSVLQSSAPDSRTPEDCRRCYRFMSRVCVMG
jgi:hypothetical protein